MKNKELALNFVEWQRKYRSDVAFKWQQKSIQLEKELDALRRRSERFMKRSALKNMMSMANRTGEAEVMYYIRTWMQKKNASMKLRGEEAKEEATDTKQVTGWLLEEYKALLVRAGEDPAVPIEMFDKLIG